MIKWTNLEKPFDLLEKAYAFAELHGTEINYELDRQAREQGCDSWENLLKGLSESDRETIAMIRDAATYNKKDGFFLNPDYDLLGKMMTAVTADHPDGKGVLCVPIIRTALRMNIETSYKKIDCSADEFAQLLHVLTLTILIELMEAADQERSPSLSKFLQVATEFQFSTSNRASDQFISSLLLGGRDIVAIANERENHVDAEKLADFLPIALRMFAGEELKVAA